MRRWSELAERVAATTRTSEKTAILADYLRSLTPEELPVAAVFLTGRPFPEADQRSMGLGWSSIVAAIGALTGATREDLAAAYDRHSDLSLSVEDVLTGAGHAPPPEAAPTLPEVAATFATIEQASGPAAKAKSLHGLLARADPLTAKAIVKVLGGELRIGLRDGLVEAAIAKAFERPLEDVKWAGMLTGDMGRLAELARDDQLADAELALFHPLKFMLASPAEDADEIIGRLGPEVWVEDKYDGIRAQLHKRGTDVRLYSRDLHDVSNQFPEIVDAARPLRWTGVIDGEILAFKDGLVLPFISLQARLGRKAPSEQIKTDIPVVFVAFDLLALGPGDDPDGDATVDPLLREPLRRRRELLDGIDLPLVDDGGRFTRSHLGVARNADALELAFADARGRRNEGLMVKDPTSGYSPGRRGLGWLKMKKALATIDCVVVGVEVGHGKRHGVLSDYTFAVRDDESGKLVNIGKAYSGLTDVEIAEMTAWFEAHTIARYGRYRQVEPTIVVEIAFDVIVRSKRHASGFSLRFPRIHALRPDKTVDDIDTVATVTALYEGLQHGSELLVTAGARTVPPG
ncbi:MAG TPA: ATP-dependent DNA ligase, partial [Candidatus Limnocylindrales bacterium]|nr:ATP-dependent DNA ligase [Candidatus Limnocylindrales bacterium]